jgi:hypothetical protein
VSAVIAARYWHCSVLCVRPPPPPFYSSHLSRVCCCSLRNACSYPCACLGTSHFSRSVIRVSPRNFYPDWAWCWSPFRWFCSGQKALGLNYFPRLFLEIKFHLANLRHHRLSYTRRQNRAFYICRVMADNYSHYIWFCELWCQAE